MNGNGPSVDLLPVLLAGLGLLLIPLSLYVIAVPITYFLRLGQRQRFPQMRFERSLLRGSFDTFSLLFLFLLFLSFFFHIDGNQIKPGATLDLTTFFSLNPILTLGALFSIGFVAVMGILSLAATEVKSHLYRADYDGAARAARRWSWSPLFGFAFVDYEGNALLFAGRYADAEAKFREALERETNANRQLRATSEGNLGWALLRQGRYAEAQTVLEQSIGRYPEGSDNFNALGELYLEHGTDPNLALQYLERGIHNKRYKMRSNRSTWSELLANQAWAYAQMQACREAQQALKQAFAEADNTFVPALAGLYYRGARVVQLCGKPEQARAFLEKAVQLDAAGSYGQMAKALLDGSSSDATGEQRVPPFSTAPASVQPANPFRAIPVSPNPPLASLPTSSEPADVLRRKPLPTITAESWQTQEPRLSPMWWAAMSFICTPFVSGLAISWLWRRTGKAGWVLPSAALAIFVPGIAFASVIGLSGSLNAGEAQRTAEVILFALAMGVSYGWVYGLGSLQNQAYEKWRKEGYEAALTHRYDFIAAALRVAVTALLFAGMGIAVVVVTRIQNQPHKFDNSSFTLTYPGAWRLGDTMQVPQCKTILDCLLQVNRNNYSNILIARFALPGPMRATDIEQQTWPQVQKDVPGIILESRDSLTVAGFSAARRFSLFPASYTPSNDQLYAETIYFSQATEAYVISITCLNKGFFEEDRQDIDSIVASLQWKAGAPAPLSSS